MYPKAKGFKMPPEWAIHGQTFVSWPIKDSMCYPDNYDNVCKGYYDIIMAIAEFEPVTVIVNPEDMENTKKLFSQSNINLMSLSHNDAWIRDNGPTFVLKEGGIAGINWEFNAWGGKYSPWDLDNNVASEILKDLDIEKYDAQLIMEGGSIHVDGEGTLLTTEECLLNPNRNPNLSKEQIEDTLKNYLGLEKVIWLKRGLSGDETDGHVDNIACFAHPSKIILQVCNDKNDENYEISQENIDILKNERDALGRKIEIIPIHQPPKTYYNDKRLTLSYLNFYFVNGGIILPVFGGNAENTDKMAEEVLQRTFPNRRIKKVDGMSIIGEGGNVHCTTQQMPALFRRK